MRADDAFAGIVAAPRRPAFASPQPGVGTLLYLAASAYFAIDLHLTVLESLYFVATTMFTVGYGDITPLTRHGGWTAIVVAIVIMGVGVTLGSRAEFGRRDG